MGAGSTGWPSTGEPPEPERTTRVIITRRPAADMLVTVMSLAVAVLEGEHSPMLT